MSTPGSTAKVVPPTALPTAIPRPALEARLDEALERRLTTVVADAGFGKSTLLAAWATRVEAVWYTLTADDVHLASFARGVIDALRLLVPALPPELTRATEAPRGADADADELARAEAFAALVCDTLRQTLVRDLVLVLDDLQELAPGTGSARLVETLSRQAPNRFHLVLASRNDPPFPVERLRGQGQVLEIAGTAFAFSVEEIERFAETALGKGARSLAPALFEATAGWPVAVRLALEALRGVPEDEQMRAIEELRAPEGALFAYLAAEVFEREPPETRELIRRVAPLERFTPRLCEELGIPDARALMSSLTRRGLFVEPEGGEAGWFSLGRLARQFALEQLPLSAGELEDVHRRAAAWLESEARLDEALRSLVAIGDEAEIARILEESGRRLLAGGRGVEEVLRAARALSPERRTPDVERLVGEALLVRGDWEGALAALERAAESAGQIDAGIAWRIGLIRYFRGELDEALATFARAELERSEPRDVALVLGWQASARWLKGDAEESREAAGRAFEAATASGDPQALATVHTVLAMLAALDGDRRANDAHYLRALDYAEQAGDLLQTIRIRANRGSRHLEEGAYDASLAELDIAIRLADLGGFASFRALALSNRGVCRFRLGRLEEAIADLEAARALYERIGSRSVSYPLANLGDVYRERGEASLARMAYEEAIAQAQLEHDLQGLVPALAGLARIVATEDAAEARRLAERAIETAGEMTRVTALLAGGWVAFEEGRRPRARALAGEAAGVARRRRDRAGLAEALELEGAAAEDESSLEEAIGIFRDTDDPLGAARAQLRLARVRGGRSGRQLAVEAEQALRTLGARTHAAAASELVSSLEAEELPPVAIQSLGRFRVLRAGRPVALSEWRSKKARDLLKMLIARRGRAVPRDVLMEALWPDEDPAKLANRLSVALSTVRTVLDPEHSFGADHFIRAEQTNVQLELDRVTIDVDDFLRAAGEGLQLARKGDPRAGEQLAVAEAAYTGDFLEENLYEDWAAPLREEARALYIDVARTLADIAVSEADLDAAARLLLRVLERDPYDERAHLVLVSTLEGSGRHGEARRAYRAYSARMEEIAVEAAPFPAAQTA